MTHGMSGYGNPQYQNWSTNRETTVFGPISRLSDVQ